MNAPTMLKISQWNKIVTLELPNSDLTVYEMLELFRDALLALGYVQESINKTILDIADELDSDNS